MEERTLCKCYCGASQMEPGEPKQWECKACGREFTVYEQQTKPLRADSPNQRLTYDNWKEQVNAFNRKWNMLTTPDERDLMTAERSALSKSGFQLVRRGFHGPTIANKALEMWR